MQYVPELAGIADDAFELRVKIVLSLDQYLGDGLISWPGNDETIEQDESYFGTKRQWKKKMMKPGTYSDTVFLQLASLYLQADVLVIPAFRESAESKTLGYTVFRSKNRTISEPMYLFYYSDSDFHSPHYQSVRPTTEHNILYNLLGTTSVNLTASTLEGPVMQSTRVSSPQRREVSSLYLPDGSGVSSLQSECHIC